MKKIIIIIIIAILLIGTGATYKKKQVNTVKNGTDSSEVDAALKALDEDIKASDANIFNPDGISDIR